MRSMSEWAEEEVRIAKDAFPGNAAVYDAAEMVYRVLAADNHSGMSWNVTVSLMRDAFAAIPWDTVQGPEGLLTWSDAWFSGIINAADTSDNMWRVYMSSCTDSARMAFNCMLNHACDRDSVRSLWDVFYRLARDLPLTPVDDTPESWVSEMCGVSFSQHVRMPSLFKRTFSDGRPAQYSDNDRVIAVEPDGSRFRGSVCDLVEGRYPIAMPYMPDGVPMYVHVETYSDGSCTIYHLTHIDNTPDGNIDCDEYWLRDAGKWVELSHDTGITEVERIVNAENAIPETVQDTATTGDCDV